MFWKKDKPIASAPPPIEFSEHFFTEWDNHYHQQWKVYSIALILDDKDNDGQVFRCWTKEDAIALMKRLDKLVNERAVMEVKS